MTFKAEKFKGWTITDDEIIIGRNKIPLTSITQVKHTPWKEGNFNGVIYIKYGSRIRDDKMLVYPMSQKESGTEVANYLSSLVLKNQRKNSSSSNMPANTKKPNIILIYFITLVIIAVGAWFIGTTFFGGNRSGDKSTKTNYEKCSMCGDKVPEDDMRGKWCKDCQNDAFGKDGWYYDMKD